VKKREETGDIRHKKSTRWRLILKCIHEREMADGARVGVDMRGERYRRGGREQRVSEERSGHSLKMRGEGLSLLVELSTCMERKQLDISEIPTAGCEHTGNTREYHKNMHNT
jgi:hypothetical protein